MPKVPSEVIYKALSSGDPAVWSKARDAVRRVDLSGADLASATLADFDLSGVDLSNADLSEADLTGAVLDRATLDGADLTAARLLELEVRGASFVGAALDEAHVGGLYQECNFAGTTWENALVRGARFIRCDFDGAEIDLSTLGRVNRFDRCTFGDRDDVPADFATTRPAFLQPPLLEGERVAVTRLSLAFADEAELRRETIGAATVAGWDAELVAFLKDGARIYVGLRPEADVDELEEWLAFEPREGRLEAVELSVDPGFETFLEEVVLPLFEAGGGDLALTIEQDLEGGRTAVTEISVTDGAAAEPRQYQR